MAISVMFGFEWSSQVFFNFSCILDDKKHKTDAKNAGNSANAVLMFDLESDELKLVYKEKVTRRHRLADLSGCALGEDDPMSITFSFKLPAKGKSFYSKEGATEKGDGATAYTLELYSTVDRSICKELVEHCLKHKNIRALDGCYPKQALHHGILEKKGKWSWSSRHCVLVKWKLYVFRDWYSQVVLNAISLIGLPVEKDGERGLLLHTAHGPFFFRCLSEDARDEWIDALALAGSMDLAAEPLQGAQGGAQPDAMEPSMQLGFGLDGDDDATANVGRRKGRGRQRRARARQSTMEGIASQISSEQAATDAAAGGADGADGEGVAALRANRKMRFEPIEMSFTLDLPLADVELAMPAIMDATARQIGVAAENIDVIGTCANVEDGAKTDVSLRALKMVAVEDDAGDDEDGAGAVGVLRASRPVQSSLQLGAKEFGGGGDSDSDGDGEGDAAALRANRPVISTMDLGTDLQGLDLSACFGQHMLRPVLSNVKLALGTREMSEAERATAAASERLTQEDLQHVSGEKEQIDYSTKSAQGQGFLAMLSHFSSLEKQQEESPPSDVLTSDNFADQFA